MSKKKRSANFNKLFATTALATAAIVVPTAVAGAEDAGVVAPTPTPIDGLINETNKSQKINYTIEVDLTKITGEYIIEKYEWFYVENVNGVDTEFPILEATSKTLKVPLEALGKSIQVNVTAKELDNNGDPVKNGELVFSSKLLHKVDNIEIIMNEISLVVPPEISVGDIITIGEIALKDKDKDKELPFENNQIKYSFQWYVKEGSKYNAIPGETNRSIEVTSKMENKTVAALVSFEFNGKEYSKFTQSETLADISADIKDLNANIDELMGRLDEEGQEQYQQGILYETFFENFKVYKQRYVGLTEVAKKQITNPEILSELEKNILIVDAFVKEIQAAKVKIPSLNNPNQTNQLTESQIESLQQIYLSVQTKDDAFDSLQRSLLKMRESEVGYATFKNDLKSLLENQQVNGLDELNEKIENLFKPVLGDFLSSYSGTLEEVSKKLVNLKEEIAKLDKQYIPFVKLNLVKQAEVDIKKAEAVVKKINKISDVTIDKKKGTATAAYKVFLALTPLQKSLIIDQYDLIEDGLNIEDTLGAEPFYELNLEIVEYLFNGPKDEDNYSTYEILDLSTANDEINTLLAKYKMLSSAEKKFISNYRYLTTAQKDIKVALKVEKLFKDAEKLEGEIAGDSKKAELSATKKALSKYKSAFGAHIKLTTLQQSLIEDQSLNETLKTYGELVIAASELEIAIKQEKNPDETIDGPNYSLPLIGNIAGLISVDQLSYTETIPNFQQQVNGFLQDYKKLSSKERKVVYNYSILSKANSDIKKASSVLAKLNAAANAKDQKKYNSALASYNKLTGLQQSLIDLENIDTSGMDEMKDAVKNVVEKIDALQMGTLQIDDINDVKNEYDALSSSQKKLVSNYNLLKEILKDVSVVKSFVSKLEKLGYNPTISQKESIVKSYYKLTDNQTKVFEENYNDSSEFQSPMDRLIAYEIDVNNKTANAKNLNDSIKNFLDNMPDDLNKLKNEIVTFDIAYSALPSTDQKLITNYSKLNRVKKDIEAVTKVIELKNLIVDENDTNSTSYKDWKKAYNRLNSRQLDLYNSPTIS